MGTPFERKMLILIFVSAVAPAAIVTVCLYYLIFNQIAWQIGIPEAIAYNVIPVAQKVSAIILISIPIMLVLIWFVALELSHTIAGPLDRLEKELEARISGEKKGHIKVRKRDELKTLVDKINRILG